MADESTGGSALIFGARNLGRATLEVLIGEGWKVAAVAVSDQTLEGVTAAGGLAIRGDITAPGGVTAALAEAEAANGPVDLVVNAASPYGGDRSGPFGGGPIAEASPEAFDDWATRPAKAAFTFLSETGRWLLEKGRPATVVQVTGGSARRAMPGRGLWAAGSFGVRAVTNAAAQELRPHGIQVTLLIVDAGIQPVSGSGRPGVDPAQLADPYDIARGILFVARQGSRAATHELQITPLAENWVP